MYTDLKILAFLLFINQFGEIEQKHKKLTVQSKKKIIQKPSMVLTNTETRFYLNLVCQYYFFC